MLSKRFMRGSCLLLLLVVLMPECRAADEFNQFLKPLFARNCIKCHGEKKIKGKINLKEIVTAKQFLAKPELIKELIEVIDAVDMPPEDEPQLTEVERVRLLAVLKTQLRAATIGPKVKHSRIRRLNRFQYNNVVRDLFGLDRDVFGLPEKLMTRRGNYLNSGLNSNKMPDRVNVRSLALKPEAGLQDVRAFPKDLRASHGFDNQANQLTLSPLLLDAFLRLSVSVLESPDFNEGNVGIWNEFFKKPAADVNMEAEVRKRLGPVLLRAFRRPVDGEVLERYTTYTLSKIKQGLPFTGSMKKVASAALSSPMFLYRYGSENQKSVLFTLASNLSFFFWASSPDLKLLGLAKSGELSKPDVLNKTINRMMTNAKIERFLDTFPSQWMQLENVLAATPDPKKHRFFSLDKNNPASLQMLMEPLLLFDAVFIEDRPIVELITPEFNYQSDFLKTWYTNDLKPSLPDVSKIVEENRRIDERLKGLSALIKTTQEDLEVLIKPVRERLMKERKKDTGEQKQFDLKPYAAWEFNGDLKSSLGNFPL